MHLFKTEGLYAVTDSFTNNCQPKGATQYVAYRRPVSGGGPSATDTICYGTNTYVVTGFNIISSGPLKSGEVGNIAWDYIGGTGNTSTFTPNSGTPTLSNILTPTFNVSPQDKAIAQNNGLLLTIKFNLHSPNPSKCAVSTSTKNLYIRPEAVFSDTSFNSCSGSIMGYQITKNGFVGANMTWTATANPIGSVSGFSSNAIGAPMITDILTGNGIVDYTITVKIGSCTGTPFHVYDTVRPIPTAPVLTLLNPNNPTHSMCSFDTAKIQMSTSNASDLFTWSSTSNQGQISGLTSGVAQPSPIINVLSNISNPPVTDTANYYIKAVSAYGCTGPQSTTYVIVTPGPPKAQVANAIVYVCNLSLIHI